MKRLVILFSISVLGIVLLQVLGGIFFSSIPVEFRTKTAIVTVIIEAILYFITLYTLIMGYKLKGGLGTKIFKVLNWTISLGLTLVFTFFTINLLETFITSHRYYNKRELNKLPETAVRANIYPMVDYTGMPKEFILGLRQGNLDSNIDKLLNYEPSEEVWAKMQDKSDWLGYECSVCYNPKTDVSRRLKGVSSLSRLINNPMMLVAPILIATYHLDESLPVCSDKGLQLIPKSIYVDNVNSKIIIVYKGTSVLTKCQYLQLSGLNARDFGLKWGKVIGFQNVKFPYENNISKKAYEFKDEIEYAEFSKNSDKKCNTYAGIDERVLFNITSYPACINLKLWNEKPLSPFKESNFNVEIRFVE